MKKTNSTNLPDEFVRALTYDDHVTKGDISVTGLIDTPRVIGLKKKFKEQYSEDIQQGIAAMIGTAFHSVMEEGSYKYRDYYVMKRAYKSLKAMGFNDLAKQIAEAAKEKFPDEIVGKEIFVERTLAINVTVKSDVTGEEHVLKVSGTQDKYETKTKILRDYKITSEGIVSRGSHHWAEQQNIYAYMLELNGFPVSKIEIAAILKDWKPKNLFKRGAKDNYPVNIIDIPIWDKEKTRQYIYDHAKVYLEMMQSGVIPECSPKDRWADNDDVIVQNIKTLKTVKKFVSNNEANRFVDEAEINGLNATELQVVSVEYQGIRCAAYCSVRKFCDQQKRFVKKFNNVDLY